MHGASTDARAELVMCALVSRLFTFAHNLSLVARFRINRRSWQIFASIALSLEVFQSILADNLELMNSGSIDIDKLYDRLLSFTLKIARYRNISQAWKTDL